MRRKRREEEEQRELERQTQRREVNDGHEEVRGHERRWTYHNSSLLSC